MTLRNSSAIGKTGFRFEDKDFADAAAIDTSKLGLRTLAVPLVPYGAALSGTSVAAATSGVFRPVLLPDANNGSLFWSFSLPANYDSGQPTIDIYWYTTVITGAVHFSLDIAFKIAGESTALDATVTSTPTVATIANQINKTSVAFSGLTIAAGDIVGLTITRQPANAGDTAAADINILMAAFRYTGRG